MSIRLADIFKETFPDYLRRYGKLPQHYYRAVNAIISCGTERLGSHQYECGTCRTPQTHYHSCRNRHCPRCQGYASMQWVQVRMNELIPVPYFHAVFTIPSELNPFVLRNKKVMYSILFRAVKETLEQLASQDKWLGAKIGFIAVLHTWGQNMLDHPHLHCIIPAGGLRIRDNRWKHCRNSFFAPVEVMRTVYKGKFMEYFKAALARKEIEFHGVLRQYQVTDTMKKLVDKLYKTTWVVYIKPSFASPEAVLQYLGSYTHRIALSEKRILSFAGGKVSFAYKDYRDDNKRKVMCLPAVEFIRRFLLHILPDGFMRIRHFGLFANRGREERINLCRKLLGESAMAAKETVAKWWEQILERTGKNPLLCPSCGNGLLCLVAIRGPAGGKYRIT